MDEPQVIIEVIGEGITDIGMGGHGSVDPELPTCGIIPILVHKLCGQPLPMRVIRRPYPHVQGGGLKKKVQLSKQNAHYNGSHSLVFVIDTEGLAPEESIKPLIAGRDLATEDVPTVVGVAHPCIESWLLADSAAVKKGLKLKHKPILPEEPETLDAPQHNRKDNPKTILARCGGSS